MSRIIGFGSLVFATSLLMAAALDPVLVDSPWVKQAPVALLLVRGEAQLREGGRLGGGGKRAGLGKVKTLPGTLEVRWESATPIRARNSRPAKPPLPIGTVITMWSRSTEFLELLPRTRKACGAS